MCGYLCLVLTIDVVCDAERRWSDGHRPVDPDVGRADVGANEKTVVVRIRLASVPAVSLGEGRGHCVCVRATCGGVRRRVVWQLGVGACVRRYKP
jgi:hypothetical protein